MAARLNMGDRLRAALVQLRLEGAVRFDLGARDAASFYLVMGDADGRPDIPRAFSDFIKENRVLVRGYDRNGYLGGVMLQRVRKPRRFGPWSGS